MQRFKILAQVGFTLAGISHLACGGGQPSASPEGVTVGVDGVLVEFRDGPGAGTQGLKGTEFSGYAMISQGSWIMIDNTPDNSGCLVILNEGGNISNSSRAGGACSIDVAEIGAVGGHVSGLFTATVLNETQQKKVLTDGYFRLPVK